MLCQRQNMSQESWKDRESCGEEGANIHSSSWFLSLSSHNSPPSSSIPCSFCGYLAHCLQCPSAYSPITDLAAPQYTSAVSHVSCNQALKQYHCTLCGRLATTYLDGSLENSFNIFCMLSNLRARNFVPRDIWQSLVSWIGDQKWKSQQLIPLSFSILVQLKGNNNVVIWPYL